jgi:hypothetical protein
MCAEFNEEFDGIVITEIGQKEEGWNFIVGLGHGDGMIEFFVDVDKEYWTRLTNRRVEPSKLVEMTFKFLLDKGIKETIQRKFNVSEVSAKFPQFEMEMKRML